MTQVEKPEYALITGGEEIPSVLKEALGAALEIRVCPGPSNVYCPILHGKRCPLRQRAKVTVVYLAGEHEFNSPGRWQCLVGGMSPAIAVLEGQSHEPRARQGFALVGAERGATGVLEAIASLFDNPD